MSKHVLSRALLGVAFVVAVALTTNSAKAETRVPVQFAIKTTANNLAAPVRTADFNSADRQNTSVLPVHFGGRGAYAYYGGGPYYGGGGFYGGGFYAGPRVNYGYRPYSVGYRAYY